MNIFDVDDKSFIYSKLYFYRSQPKLIAIDKIHVLFFRTVKK